MARCPTWKKDLVERWPFVLDAARKVGLNMDLLATIAQCEVYRLEQYVEEHSGMKSLHGERVAQLMAADAAHRVEKIGKAQESPQAVLANLKATDTTYMDPVQLAQHRKNQQTQGSVAASVAVALRHVDAVCTKNLSRTTDLGRLGPDSPRDLVEAEDFALWCVMQADKDLVAEWRAQRVPPPDDQHAVFLLRAAEQDVQDIRRELERHRE